MHLNNLLVILACVPIISAISVEDRFNKLEAELAAIDKKWEHENFELKKENADLKKTVGSLRETFELFQKHLDLPAQVATKQTSEQNKKSKVEVCLNDTADLEARVAVLEGDVVEIKEDLGDLEGDVQNIESINILQDQRINEQDGRINIVEADLLDNDEDIEGLLESTNSLTGQVLGLDQRVVELESNNGGGDNSNITELTKRVQTLEIVTSQLDDVTELLDQRVDVLESGTNDTVADNADTIFLAALGYSTTSIANPVIFDRSEINSGGHYDNTTGYYTVPRDGVYEFHVQMQAYSSSSGYSIYIYLMVDGQLTHYDNWSNYPYRSFSVILELQAGQRVNVQRANNGAQGHPTILESYFWGRMISAN